ncbi:hypothetical protein FACS1894187_19980 [Synergistales bacterium]|nr:hypothetical protein FACS1894187_19980 [Synergistales bacterium]
MALLSISDLRARVDETINQSLSTRFVNTIPEIEPNYYIDLLPQIVQKENGDSKNMNMAICSKTKKIGVFEADTNDFTNFLIENRVRTVGILDPHCTFRTFNGASVLEVKNQIRSYLKSNTNLMKPEEMTVSSFVFQGKERFFGYASMLSSHSRTQISARFKNFLESGGSIVSVQDRVLPITRFVADKEKMIMNPKQSILFCELSDHAIQFWIVVNFDDQLLSPLVSELSGELSKSADWMSSVDFLVNSVVMQTEKQHQLWSPTLAVFIDNTNFKDHVYDDAVYQGILGLLSKACGKVVELRSSEHRNASLLGAFLLKGGELD